MDKIRKTIKTFTLSLLLFFIMTMMLCALITYTGFAEKWGYVSLIAIITASTFILGYLEASVVGTRGLIVGIAASTVLIMIILVLTALIFNEDFSEIKHYIFLTVPVLAGGMGGVLGINRNKS